MENIKKRKVYVVGHKNPDTDSICSAIAYAALKQQIAAEDENNYFPMRAGMLNEETQYILKHFGVEEPRLLANVHLRVQDVDVNRMPGISSHTSIKDAWAMMKERNVYTLAVTDEERLEGVITTSDIATSYMDVYDSHILADARTQYQNIANTLDGEVISGNPHAYFIKGKVAVAASSPEMMESYIEKDDLVVLGNRYESQLCAVELDASCLVVCQGAQVSRTILKLAQERDIVIITTPHDTFTVSRLINQSIPVKHFMEKDGLTIFNTTDYVENIKDVMAKKRARDFAVIDKEGKFYGFISSRRLMDARNRRVIMVDHNEKTQAVDGIEEAEILEIIDHHRLGSLETVGPVYFRNQPVGCTATIIYQMYQENNQTIEKNIAGILCAAILSDTLLFRSPTCTPLDEATARSLAEIAQIDLKSFAMEMFEAGSSLKNKTPEELFNQDYKTFQIEKIGIGVSQISSINQRELDHVAELMQEYVPNVLANLPIQLSYIMLTNIHEQSSTLLAFGANAVQYAEEAFHVTATDNTCILPGVVSRKKQVIPVLVSRLQEEI